MVQVWSILTNLLMRNRVNYESRQTDGPTWANKYTLTALQQLAVNVVTLSWSKYAFCITL